MSSSLEGRPVPRGMCEAAGKKGSLFISASPNLDKAISLPNLNFDQLRLSCAEMLGEEGDMDRHIEETYLQLLDEEIWS